MHILPAVCLLEEEGNNQSESYVSTSAATPHGGTHALTTYTPTPHPYTTSKQIATEKTQKRKNYSKTMTSTVTPAVTSTDDMATISELKAAIERMSIIMANELLRLAKIEKSKAEKSNTDTTEFDRKISVGKMVLEAAESQKKELMKELEEAIAKSEKRVTKAQVDHWWSLPEESRGEDPRGAAPDKNFIYCYKEQAWINKKKQEGRGMKRKKEPESNDGSKKQKENATKNPKRPMEWGKLQGVHNGQFFYWDRNKRKMVSSKNIELSFKFTLNDGDSWEDVVWSGRRALVIQPAYSSCTAYGAYGTTGHVLIIKPDKEEWTRKELYSAIESAFLNDMEDYGTGNPKPRLCLDNYNRHPFLEGLFLTNDYFEVDGKQVPILQCRWGS